MEKKSTTISIINDAEGNNLKAFTTACNFVEIEYQLVSSKDAGILDISIKYLNEGSLFALGMSYQLQKASLFVK